MSPEKEAVPLYVPAGTPTTLQVKMVWLGINPFAAGVDGEQVNGALDPDPCATFDTVHVTDPAGAVAPTIPETVAVKTIVFPNTGVVAGALITIVGVAKPTTTSSGGVEVSAEK